MNAQHTQNKETMVSMSTTPNMLPRIVVVDDDPLFLKIIAKNAKQQHIDLTTCQSLSELAILATTHLFDIAIVDYYLDGIKIELTGSEVAKILESTPVLLISQNVKELSSPNMGAYPRSVIGMFSKANGPKAILQTAVSEWKYERLKALASSTSHGIL